MMLPCMPNTRSTLQPRHAIPELLDPTLPCRPARHCREKCCENVPRSQRCRALFAQQRLTLGLVVVHAVLASQRLDQVLERCVAPHVVAVPNRLLDLQDRQGCAGRGGGRGSAGVSTHCRYHCRLSTLFAGGTARCRNELFSQSLPGPSRQPVKHGPALGQA